MGAQVTRWRSWGLAVAVAVIATTGGCAWQVAATRATGLCTDAPVRIEAASKQSWRASCGGAQYRCGYDPGLGYVECDYLPICGNDRHHETRSGRFRR